MSVISIPLACRRRKKFTPPMHAFVMVCDNGEKCTSPVNTTSLPSSSKQIVMSGLCLHDAIMGDNSFNPINSLSATTFKGKGIVLQIAHIYIHK